MTLPVANPNLGAPSPSWGGFMQLASKGEFCKKTRTEILPFINLQPTNPSSIYTALNFAREQSSLHGMETCFVTFDQPLYAKAIEIVASDEILQGVVVRLGGFHLLMSFMGSVGYIMGGSGLEVLWESVYAPASVVHMMTEMEDKTKESLSALHKAIIVVDSSVNCDRYLEIEVAAASALDNQLYSEIKLRRTDRVKSIGTCITYSNDGTFLACMALLPYVQLGKVLRIYNSLCL
ncbi:hypothetical protein CAPTEDRAFT_209293 [Capitella teleta]|uniref:Uncharacterized protein n=1 Tax=Capitella teleta TaxID=283909 RepID=R7VAL5_CAPTE|nr:hypothetical protein CAPTEDRAFT_209293 [Capitella teleta]|eukprot:ELU13381.1 hypothetical protein CAPTEDRAFT_209293 [Capitella teleta]